MRRLVVTLEAKLDINDILAQSQVLLGPPAAIRYRRLIDRALTNLIVDPSRNGVGTKPGLQDAVRLYPLRVANYGVARSERVSRPRHVVAFTYDVEEVLILRVLHDRMDAGEQLGGG